jgi:hypothetical protein
MVCSRAAVSTGFAAPKMDTELGGAVVATDRLMGAAATVAAGISVTGALPSSIGTVRDFRDNFGLSLVGSNKQKKKNKFWFENQFHEVK